MLISPDEQETEVDAEFMWTIPDVVGLYVVRTTFDQEGTWWVRLRPEGLGPTPPAAFTVSTDDRVPGVGDPAPAVETRTLDDHSARRDQLGRRPRPALLSDVPR